MPTNIYHERQQKQMCALHALNNLFQARATFTKEELDEICSNLSPNVWINPHRSVLGLGNYDINVIMTALQLKKYEAAWFDKRKDPACIDLNAIVGFILNVPSDYKLGLITLPLRRRHWIAVRRIGDTYYNLDSKLNAPEVIGNEVELLTYLRAQLETNERELFVVVEQNQNNENSDQSRWLKTKIESNSGNSNDVSNNKEQNNDEQVMT